MITGKRLVQRAVRALGYEIRPLPSFERSELQKVHHHPGLSRYTDSVVVLEARLEDGRGLRVHPLAPASGHPYVDLAAQLVRSPGDLRSARLVLERHYRGSPPATFADWTGVGHDNAILSTSPPHAVPLPWVDRAVEEQARRSNTVVRAESKAYGPALSVTECFPPAGPMSERAIDAELRRTDALVESVRVEGYRRQRTIDAIGARVLIGDGSEWAWLVSQGHHRAAVAAAFELGSVPIAVFGIVRLDELCCWPGVIRGYYTPDEAEAIFNLIFAGAGVPASRVTNRNKDS